MTTLENRPNTALVVIDVQNGVVEAAHERDAVVANIASLVDKARREQVPVVWVQHADEQLARGSDDWRIVPELAPGDAEPLVEKNYGDAFEGTTLETVLSGLGVGRLVVAGAQTDACIRSTLHGAFVRGTTRPLSAMPTRLTTTRNGARRRRTRSSPTRTCTGPTRRLQGGRPGRSRPRMSTSAGRPDARAKPMGVGSLLRPGSLGLALRPIGAAPPGSLALRGGRVLLREPLRAPFAVAGVQDGSRHGDQTDEDKARRRAEGPVERSIVGDSQNCQDVCHEKSRLAVLQNPSPQGGAAKRGRRGGVGLLAAGARAAATRLAYRTWPFGSGCTASGQRTPGAAEAVYQLTTAMPGWPATAARDELVSDCQEQRDAYVDEDEERHADAQRTKLRDVLGGHWAVGTEVDDDCLEAHEVARRLVGGQAGDPAPDLAAHDSVDGDVTVQALLQRRRGRHQHRVADREYVVAQFGPARAEPLPGGAVTGTWLARTEVLAESVAPSTCRGLGHRKVAIPDRRAVARSG